MYNRKPNKDDSGITLIALIITIVVLIILVAIALKGLTGGEGIIDVAGSAADNYKIAEYKEQVEITARNTILSKANIGEDISIGGIAEGLKEETTWVSDAYANIDTAISNEDVITTTIDGYVYQLYYDKTYGAVFVEYLGRKDSEIIPNLVAKYERSIASIVVRPKIEKGSIEKVELIYKGEVIQNITDIKEEMRLEVDKSGTGWYIVRVTSDKGKIRYAWIRVTNVTDKLTPPEITLTPEEPESGWYKTKPVSIAMTTNSPAATEIHYILTGVTEKEETKVDGKTASDSASNSGRTTITAWTEDGKGFSSQTVTKEIRIDDERPSIAHTETSNKNQVGIWYKDNVTVEITGTDNHSGIAGYLYKIEGEHTNFIRKNIEDKIIVSKEGVTTIKAKTIDVAGNESDEKTITIHKDTTIPDTAQIRFKSNTINSITVEATGNDQHSGVAGYTFEYRLSGAASTAWNRLSNGAVTSTAGVVTYTYSGIARGEYAVRVIVTDAAGNSTISSVLSTNTILNRAPVWSNNGSTSGVTRTSMNILATATDADNDKLTYKFYWSTSSSMPGSPTATSAATAAGTQVSFSRSGLGMNTTYYYRIDVTDGIDTTVGTVKSAKTNANNSPAFSGTPTGTVSNITTITVKATATDADGDQVTYKLYWGTSSGSLSLINTKTGNTGAQITFDARSSLGNYTTYYWRVDIADAYGGARTGTVYSTRTWCRTTQCNGPFSKQVDCTRCIIFGKPLYEQANCNGYFQSKASWGSEWFAETWNLTYAPDKDICKICGERVAPRGIEFMVSCADCGTWIHFYPVCRSDARRVRGSGTGMDRQS